MRRIFILSACLATLAILAEGSFAPPSRSTTPSTASNPGIRVISDGTPSSPSPKAQPKQLYFDWTSPIDELLLRDEEADSNLLQNLTNSRKGSADAIPNVFYSTDSLVSNLPDLAPVTNLLDKHELKKSPLLLSFRFMHGQNISDDRMGDVFYSLDSSLPEDKLKSLSKHVSGILLDFQASYENSHCYPTRYYDDYKSHQEKLEAPSWKVPFPKYAKKIVQKLFTQKKDSSVKIKIGVLYDEDQLLCYKLAEQLKNADFVVINMKFEVERKFPLSYDLFRRRLEQHAKFHNSYFLSRMGVNVSSSFNGSNSAKSSNIMFKISLAPPNPMYLNNLYGEDPEKVKAIVEQTQHAYLPLLKKFARKWTEEGRSELILSSSLNPGQCENPEEVIISRIEGKQWIVPYLHVQEVDVTPCQLRTMMGQTAREFSSLVVNEYTWSAFARYEGEMTSKSCPNGLDLPANPPETYLVFSSGIGGIWNRAESYFDKLLRNHQTVSGWYLSTLVFRGKDVMPSACDDDGGEGRCVRNDQDIPTDQRIARFATEMHEKFKIGCLVEVDGALYASSNIRLSKSWVNDTTIKNCQSLWDISSLIIWQFDVRLDLEETSLFSFRYDVNDLKSNLLLLVARRETFMKEFPEKEVILQLNIPNANELIRKDKRYEPVSCGPSASELRQFYHAIQTWAGIHGVRVILSPAYHMEEPTRGLWVLPKEDGKPNEFNWEKCGKAYEY